MKVQIDTPPHHPQKNVLIINKYHNPFCDQTIFGTNKFKSMLDLSTKFHFWISNSFCFIAIQR